VWKNEAPRPTFLIPRVLHAAGSARPFEPLSAIPGLLKAVVADSRSAEGWWTALEPLIFVLVVAGYDSPEIVIARWDVSNEYLRLLAWRGYVKDANAHVIVGTGDWRTLTGAEATIPPSGGLDGMQSDDPLDGMVAISLRVRARRWLEQPIGGASPYPALPLSDIAFVDDDGKQIPARYMTGLGPGEPPAGPANPFAGETDGWITFTQPFVGAPSLRPLHGNAKLIGRRIAEALAAAWNPSGSTRVGLVGCFNPATWDSPRTYAEPLENFNEIATDIWNWMKSPANLEWTLTRELRDGIENESEASSLAVLSLARAAAGRPFDVAKVDPFVAARADLKYRHRLLQAREANGRLLVEQLGPRHWLILLFILHEYGLIRLLPFGVSDPAILPSPAVAGDIPPVDLTGLYETGWSLVDAQNQPITATMQINQAGDCLDGWVTDEEFFRFEFTATLDRSTYHPSRNIDTPRLRFAGTIEDDATRTIVISDVPWPDTVNFEIRVRFAYSTGQVREATMSRRDRRARMRPSLVGETVPEEVESALEPADPPAGPAPPLWTKPRPSLELQLTPLHLVHALGIQRTLGILCSDLNAMYDGTPKSKISETATKMLNELVANRVLDSPAVPGVPSPLLHRFRLDAPTQLMAETVAVSVTCLDYLVNSVIVEEPAASQTLLDLLALDLSAAVGAPDTGYHRYDFSIDGWGLHGVGALGAKGEVGGFDITCSIQHLALCAPVPGPHGWDDHVDYDGYMAEVAVGAGESMGAAVNLTTTGNMNTLWTRGEWSKDDFVPSAMQVVSVAFSASGYAIVGGGGSPPLPPEKFRGLEGTQVELVLFSSKKGRAISEPSPNSGWTKRQGVGAGVDYSVSFGATLGWLTDRAESERPVAVRTFGDTQVDVPVENFDDDGWQLRDGMRLLLARNVARYRSLLESPTAVVRIEGDSDTTKPPEVNDPLSWKRALAAYAWIRALLTTARPPKSGTTSGLAPSADRISVTGYGELRALNEGKLKQEVSDAEWRRVNVQMNDQVVVIL
jgi:outer membrane protein OmpA-like peptidoglycan-associated protein